MRSRLSNHFPLRGTRGQPDWWNVRPLIVIMLSLVPSVSYALPTPDTLIATAQLLPIVATSLLSAIAAVGLFARKKLKSFRDPVGVLLRTCAGLSILFFFSLLAVFFLALKISQLNHIENVSTYYRSEPALDELEQIAIREFDLWYDSGTISYLSYDDLSRKIKEGAEPIIIDVDRHQLRYDSGSIAHKHGGAWIRSVYLRRSEVQAYLEQLLRTDPANARRPIVFNRFYYIARRWPFSHVKEFRETLHKFEQIYSLPRPSFINWENIFSKFENLEVVVQNDAGDLVPARRTRGFVDYPVRYERLAYDEGHINFPNLLRMLTTEELVAHLQDPEVEIIAAYDSMYRSLVLYKYYLQRFFPQLDERRIRYLDFNSADISQKVKAFADDLVGRKFITIGLTKQDWIYRGLDIPHVLWQRHGRSNSDTFGYLGSSVQTPEAAAMIAVNSKGSLLDRAIRKFGRWTAAGLVWLMNGVELSLVIVLAALGVLIRLILSPLTYLEAKSRFLRGDMLHYTNSLSGSDYSLGYLRALTPELCRLLGARTIFELAGVVVSLGLIVAVGTLVMAGAEVDSRLSESLAPMLGASPAGAVLLTMVILVKMALGRAKPILPHGKARAWGLVTLIVVLPIALLLVPAFLVWFACCLLGTALAVEAWARHRTRGVVERLFSFNQAAGSAHLVPDSPTNPLCLPLESITGRSDIGNKAMRLAQVTNSHTRLFGVPFSVVLMPDLVARSLDIDDGYQANLRDTLVGCLGDRPGPFAVRSCALSEDGREHSEAGKYDTVLNVIPDELINAVKTVAESYQRAGNRSEAILVQEMVPADLAGVMFTRAPNNRLLGTIEYSRGLADGVVSGRETGSNVKFGRLTGMFYEPEDSAGISMLGARRWRLLCARLCLVGHLLESRFGAPQDVEWAYRRDTDKLFVLQSRDITAFVGNEAIELERERVIERDFRRKDGFLLRDTWIKSNIEEVASSPSRLTVSLIERIYSNKGARGNALHRLNIHAAVDSGFRVAFSFGQFFEHVPRNTVWHAFRIRLSYRALERALVRDGAGRIIDDIRQRTEVLRHECQRSLPRDPSRSLDDVLSTVAQSLSRFCDQTYALAYEINVIANVATVLLKKHHPGLLDEPELIPRTRTTQLYRDLSRLSRDPGQLDSFVEYWGHRSVEDYELAHPSFREKPQSAIDFARLYTGLEPGCKLEDTLSMSRNLTDLPLAGAWINAIELKEDIKDLCIRSLRQNRAALLDLACAAGASDESQIFSLTLEELLRFSVDNRGMTAIAQWFATDSRDTDSRADQIGESPGDTLDLSSLELMSDRVSEQVAARREGAGIMVSVQSAFRGPLRIVKRFDEGFDQVRQGDVVYIERLDPRIVSVFERITGVISTYGGELSHAAIVAREMGVPVVTGYTLPAEYDGEEAEVEVDTNGQIHFHSGS